MGKWKHIGVLGGIGLLLAVGGEAHSDVNLNKLREAAYVQSSVSFYASYQTGQGYVIQTDENPDPPTLDELAKTLKGGAEDADRYAQLADALQKSDPAASKAAAQQAIVLYREQLKAKPGDGLIRAHLANALWDAEKQDEALSESSEAVRAASGAWQAWVARGRMLASAAMVALNDPKDKPGVMGMPAFAAYLRAHRPSETQWETARQRIRDSQAAFSKAVALAPHEGRVYAERAVNGAAVPMVEALHTAFAGSSPPTDADIMGAFQQGAATLMKPESVADMLKAAQYDNGDPLAIGVGAFFFLLSRAAALGGFGDDNGMLSKLSKPDQATVNGMLARLETMQADSNRTRAASAAKMRGMLTAMTDGKAQAIPVLQKAVALAPDDVQSGSLLTSFLLAGERYSEAVPVLEAQIRRKPTVRRHLLLARAEDGLHQTAAACNEIETAMRLAPKDYTASLALAAFLIRHAETESEWREAGEQMQAALKLYPAEADAWTYNEYCLLRAIYMALTGHTEEAKKAITDLHTNDTSNKNITKAWEAFNS